MLMEQAISYLVSEGVGTVKLDAVPNIAGLYRKLGFVDEYDSLRFAGINQEKQKANNSSVLQIDSSMISGISEFDAKCFGAERTRVLCRLFSENPDLSFVSCSGSGVTGYITCRRAVTGYNLGPWVCDPGQTSVAEALLLNCLKRMESNAKIFVGCRRLTCVPLGCSRSMGSFNIRRAHECVWADKFLNFPNGCLRSQAL